MPDSSSPTSNVLSTAQQFLAQENLSGWLVYDYRHSNPIFWQLIAPSGHVTRPCFLHVPAASQPELLVHHVDAGKFAQSGTRLRVYRNRQDMIESLTRMLAGVSRVAMEYSPLNALPRVSRVDAGTIELVRGIGPGRGLLRRPDAVRNSTLVTPAIGGTPPLRSQAGPDC